MFRCVNVSGDSVGSGGTIHGRPAVRVSTRLHPAHSTLALHSRLSTSTLDSDPHLTLLNIRRRHSFPALAAILAYFLVTFLTALLQSIFDPTTVIQVVAAFSVVFEMFSLLAMTQQLGSVRLYVLLQLLTVLSKLRYQ
jgi:hypothetical protein